MNLSQYKGPGDVVAEIKMLRNTDQYRSFLIVEGPDDQRLFKHHTDPDACELVMANGKTALLEVIRRLNAQTFQGALGVTDNDCDSLDGRARDGDNLIALSEARDLDTWLIWSPALDKFLHDTIDQARLRGLGGTGGVRQRLAAAARPLGELRRWALLHQKALDFKRLHVMNFVDDRWQPRAQPHEQAAQLLSCDPDQILGELQALSAAPDHLVCHGHDLLSLLHRGMARGGILEGPNISVPQLRASLRLALERAHWGASQLARDIRAWEATNPPFRCLCSAA
jgi:hypothetical protein